MNWNVEGLRGVLNTMPENIFSDYDVCILTETFVTETTTINIEGHYHVHIFATLELRGRPAGGVTCLLKATMSLFKVIINSDNLIMVKAALGTIIGAYFRPECSAVDIIENLGQALNNAPRTDRIILAGILTAI